MKKSLSLAFLFMGLFEPAFSQQLPLNDQYIYNRFQLSPAYAGLEEASIFLGYRNERINFPGSTLQNFLSINAPVANNMALGGQLMYDQTDIFKHIYASLNYTYRVKLTEEQQLHFSLWGGIYENTLDFTNKDLSYILDDPVVADKMNQRGTALHAGAAVLYNYNRFHFGLDIPVLLESGLNYKNGELQSPYKLRRNYMVHSSYFFPVNKDWDIEPIGIVRYAPNTPVNWEFASRVIYKKNYWMSINMRSSMDLGIGLGFLVNNVLLINYNYEYTFKNLGIYDKGSHEIGIGYYLGRSSAKKARDKAYEQALLRKIDSLTRYTQQLEEKLKKTKITTDSTYQNKIIQLENKLKEMEENMERVINQMSSLKEEQKDTTQKDTSFTSKKMYYIVVESYKKLEKAVRGKEIWAKRGLQTLIIFKEETGWYHLYTERTDELRTALRWMNQLRKSQVPDAWILIYK